ncbi:MAG TPA: ATP-binding protein [Usitatibacteraceae bacterium]|nr:ATP-binding protein [Usitatibacteraceae bacterium]
MFPKVDTLIARLEALAARAEAALPAAAVEPDWRRTVAFRWRRRETIFGRRGELCAVAHPHLIRFEDLADIDEQKARVDQNTRQFVAGLPANNVLLTGARGTGKSSLIKAALERYAAKGLRLIEVDRADLVDLPDIAELVARRPERFIVFCDDLSFEAHDAGFKALKSVLDGGIAAPTANMLIYATSNRRHLMPELMQENLEARHAPDGEIHPGETTEEKVSLSERFGLWLSFYPFDQATYLKIAEHWVGVLTGRKMVRREAMIRAALLWSLERGGRSGRTAYQFARDWAGRESGAKAGAASTGKRKRARA